MKPEDLLCSTPKGLYCPPGDFYIDPVRAVDRAVVTHGHADHARAGHSAVLATPETLNIMASRYGDNFTKARQPARYNEKVYINGVEVSFAPAGHVLGSAQAVVEYKGLRMVCTGDYKRRRDPTCTGFEPVPCHVFISEATFGLPVFRHPDDRQEIAKLLDSVRQFPDRTHLVGVYALGKAQRVIALLREAGYDETMYLHGALVELCELYQNHGIELGDLAPATLERASAEENKRRFAGRIVLGPSSSFSTKWAQRFPDPVICFCSGWMRMRQWAKRQGVERPVIISDHADWDELTKTVQEIRPDELWVTHGREDALVRWAGLHGFSAQPLRLVGYEDETD